MWIKTTTDLIDASEPQLGKITETEIMENGDEGLDILLNVMADDQECPVIFTTECEVTDEVIELHTADYLNAQQIDMLNDMFIEDNAWDYIQLKYALDHLQIKEIK